MTGFVIGVKLSPSLIHLTYYYIPIDHFIQGLKTNETHKPLLMEAHEAGLYRYLAVGETVFHHRIFKIRCLARRET